MATHEFVPTRFHNTFGTHEPALYVGDGESVHTITIDAAGYDAENDQVAERGNPLTGPFWLEGAEPGDMVAVHIDALRPNRKRGFSKATLAANVVDPDFVPRLSEGADKLAVDWKIDLVAGTAKLAEPPAGLERLVLPLAPMLGCIGVAPAGDQALSTATSGPYGGNMDYRGVRAGVTLYFPVNTPGALVYVGDCHALQGDGEMSGTGVEISSEVAFTLHLHKGKDPRWPRGEDDDFLFTIGNARPLDQAVQHATTEMVRWLVSDFGLSPSAAGLLLSQCVAYDLGNMFDPAYTMVCKVPKRVLERLGG